MEVLIVFGDLLNELPQLFLLGLEPAFDLVQLNELLRPLVNELFNSLVLGLDLEGRLVYALRQGLLEFLEPLLVL